MRRVGSVVTAIAGAVVVAANVTSAVVDRVLPRRSSGPNASDLYLSLPPSDIGENLRRLVAAQIPQPQAMSLNGSNTRVSNFTLDAWIR